MPMADQKKIALLIDAENISPQYIELIFNEIREYGFATYKRIYGQMESLNYWKIEVFKYAMTPIVQFNYTSGKNASDSALIIDAMDILYTGNVDGFCLVTSDSDFTKLAIRLREAGMFVIGMGEKKTPESLTKACEEFKYLDMLFSGHEQTKHAKLPDDDNLLPNPDKLQDLIAGILDTVFKGEEWVKLVDLANAIPKSIPGFSVKFYGCSKLKQLMTKFSDRFEMSEMSKENSMPTLYIREKQ